MRNAAPAGRRFRHSQSGLALLALLAILVLGSLAFFVDQLTPESVEIRRQQRTMEALVQARDALAGYALRHRETQVAKDTDDSGTDDRAMVGYLPLPDLGSSRNNNPDCSGEGCDANYFPGVAFDANGLPPTVVGRFPWQVLGTGPLRDGHNECLWLIVSGSHGRIQRTSPAATPPAMNWDTLSQLDIVTAQNASALRNVLASRHARPLAIIFAPGQALPGQSRSDSTTDAVTQCGGNYNAANYLESLPAIVDYGLPTQRNDSSNTFPAATNSATGATSTALTKPVARSGTISLKDGNYQPGKCDNCTPAANDQGVALEGDRLFSQARNGLAFRADINSLLDRMVGCLRDKIAAGTGFAPANITGFTMPSDKTAGRIPADSCYDDNRAPLGYFSNYSDQIFVAKPNAGLFTVGSDTNCSGVLLFAGQRGAKNPAPSDTAESTTQLRNAEAVSPTNSRANTDWMANYLESGNLTNFTGTGTTFSGGTSLQRISSTQTAAQDIARCIPNTASLNQVVSPALNAIGGQLTSYNPGTQTLTLGRIFSISNTVRNANAGAFFGASWTPEVRDVGSGVRIYFKFRISDTGEGFTFAIIDGDRNGANVAGAARQHLGYSGNNGVTPAIAYPKVAIEFDTTRQGTFNASSSNPLANGRTDPNYTGGHFGIVYWGSESATATTIAQSSCANNAINQAARYWSGGTCYLKAEEDDNVHGRAGAGARPPPTNPSAPATPTLGAGVYKLDANLSQIPVNQDIHVRVEITRVSTNAANRSTTWRLEVWLLKDSPTDANRIAAMRNTTRAMSALYPGFAAHVTSSPVIYDIQGTACGTGGTCAGTQVCGSDNICYAPAFRTARLGFTTSQSTAANDQIITVSDFFISGQQ